MLTIGVDAHRRMLYCVVIDERGRERDHVSVRNTATAWSELLVRVELIDAEAEQVWGIEGSGHAGRGLAQMLVSQGVVVYEVNPRLTAEMRSRSRSQDKSDRHDGLAIARLVQHEAGTLPLIQPEDATTPLTILTRERQTVQTELTRERNRLHAELLQVDPTDYQQVSNLTTRAGIADVLAWDEQWLGPVARIQLQVVQRRARRLLALMDDLETISTQIRSLSRSVCRPLTELFGVAELTAGMLAGYLGPGDRFSSEAQLARYAGVAPLEVSSAGKTRHRLNRYGHRRLNELIHRIALTQSQRYAPAKAYVARRQAEGKSWRDAIRALKRYVARAIYSAWKQCLADTGIAAHSLCSLQHLT